MRTEKTLKINPTQLASALGGGVFWETLQLIFQRYYYVRWGEGAWGQWQFFPELLRSFASLSNYTGQGWKLPTQKGEPEPLFPRRINYIEVDHGGQFTSPSVTIKWKSNSGNSYEAVFSPLQGQGEGLIELWIRWRGGPDNIPGTLVDEWKPRSEDFSLV